MRLLFDNGTPAPLRRHLGDHVIHTAAQRGWATLANGLLLDNAEQAGYEVLVTTDQSMRSPFPSSPIHPLDARPQLLGVVNADAVASLFASEQALSL